MRITSAPINTFIAPPIVVFDTEAAHVLLAMLRSIEASPDTAAADVA